jgi:hypothetical protein
MGLSLLEMMFSIFRGHIPDSVERIAAPVAISPGALMGVLAAVALSTAAFVAAMWAAVSLAIRLI